jgi:hypothetical protein
MNVRSTSPLQPTINDDAVPKCPHCRTYLFPQEVSKAMWCCKKGKCYRYTSRGHSQPTNTETIVLETSQMRGNFRMHSRSLNRTFSFAAFGIKYGAVDQSFAPPYFMRVSGMPYYRMLFANGASEPPANPLHMYMYDSDYQLRDNPLPQRLRGIVKRCMLQTNDLARTLRNLANEHNVEEISLHINSDSSARAAPQPTQPTERPAKVTKINFD